MNWNDLINSLLIINALYILIKSLRTSNLSSISYIINVNARSVSIKISPGFR